MLMTSQENNSQNEPQHQQGVTRPQLILAVVSAEILQMRSTSPLSGCTMSTIMLVMVESVLVGICFVDLLSPAK
jgi:hypothetical protein